MAKRSTAQGRIWTRTRSTPLVGLVGAALLLAGTGTALISTAFDAQPAAEVLGGNLPVNAGAGELTDIRAQNTPTVVRSPADPAIVAVANRIDTPRYSCALHVSRDGGESWEPLRIPLPQGSEKCYAPEPAFGADGTLYVSFVTLKGRGNVPDAGWIVSSEDDGRSLSEPVKALGPLSFQVRLIADPERPGRLYRAWLTASDVGLFRFTEAGNPIRFARSDDGGQTWSAPVRVNAPARGRAVAPSLALGPGGELYVLYLDLGGDRLDYEGAHLGQGGPPYQGDWKLVLARSDDGGRSWGESVAEERLVPTERFIAFIPPFPSLAVDPESGRVYAGFHDGRSGDPDVSVWSLEDGASSWDGPVRVNDTPQHDTTAQYLPKLTVAPDGRLDVLYYDRRKDPDNVLNEVSLQSSFDHGQTFTSRLRLSDRAFSSRVGFGSERGMPDLGGRLALLSASRRTLAVWTDTRAGTEASGKQDLTRAVIAFSDPPRLAPALKYGLRWGGFASGLIGVVLLLLWVTGTRVRGGGAVGSSRGV